MRLFTVVLFLFVFAFTGCSFKDATDAKIYTRTETDVLGTIVNLKFYVNPEQFNTDVLRELSADIKRLEKVFSATDRSSTLSILNDHGRLDLDVKGAAILVEDLKNAVELMKHSEGSFNPFLGSLIGKWGFYDEFSVPDKDTVKDEVRKIRQTRLVFSPEAVYLEGGGKIDLGGIAKGHIADLIAKKCRKMESVFGGIIDAGGDIIVFGTKGNFNPFTVGIREPVMGGGIREVLKISDPSLGAVATSGDYERSFTVDGKTYHHLLDPFSGYPKKNEIASVTVLSSSLELSDSIATAIFTGGIDWAEKLKKNYKFEYVIITHDDKMICSDLAEKLLK